MQDLPFSVDRDILICATRDTAFRHFTDPVRWQAWLASAGQDARTTVLEVEPPHRIVFAFGYDRAGASLPPDSSRVTITLSDRPGGTRVLLQHHVATAALRDELVAGWRYLMGVFADRVAADQHAGATAIIDRYLAAWSETDAAARRAALAASCTDDVVYRDRYGFSSDRDDLDGHIAAAQRHLPARLERDGEVRLAAGLALIDWKASKDGGEPVARGTSVIELAPGGAIARITAVWR